MPGWLRAFSKSSNRPASWQLGEEGFPCPAGCCRCRCQVTLIPACPSPASHRSPVLQHHFIGPHPAQTLHLRQRLAVPPASPVTEPAPSSYLWLDAAGRAPTGTRAAAVLPGSLWAFAAQRSRAGSWRKSEEMVRENLGNGKGKKKINKNPGTWQVPTQVSMRNPTWPSPARACAGALPGLSRGQRRCQCPPNFRRIPAKPDPVPAALAAPRAPSPTAAGRGRFPDAWGADNLLLLP